MSFLTATFDQVIAHRLDDQRQRDTVVQVVMEGFNALQKRPVPDLLDRVRAMEKRVTEMVEDIRVEFVNGKLVVKVVGSSEALMVELRRGSNWFEPWDKVDDVVFGAVFIDPPK